MKTVHFFHDYSPKMAGSYSSLQYFLAALRSSHHTPQVVSFDRPRLAGEGEVDGPGIRVVARQDAASRYYRYVSRQS